MKRPSEYVRVPLSPARVERMWANVSSPSPRRAVGWMMMVALAAALAVLIVALRRPRLEARATQDAPTAKEASSSVTSGSVTVETPAPSVSASAPTPQKPARLGARALFDRAMRARLEGHQEDAANDFARIVAEFPRDARAALAAYELGRIRLGSLHQPRAAVGAFDFAIAHGGGATFTIDAEVGRIEALAASGDLAACRSARDAFVSAHPTSDQRKRVERACGP